jgi:hypothetical protein
VHVVPSERRVSTSECARLSSEAIDGAAQFCVAAGSFSSMMEGGNSETEGPCTQHS